MFLTTPSLWALALSSTVLAAPTARGTKATGCAAVRKAYNLAKKDGVPTVKPSVALACLESVPIDVEKDVALIDYLLPYAQFQSTLGYLKAPPKEYLLPGVDYQAAHDGHFGYSPALLSVFALRRTFQLVSISEDGTTLPKVYIDDDILFQSNSSTISPVESIDDIPIDNFLTQEAHMQGLQDPDAQYNAIFFSPAIQTKYQDHFVAGSYVLDFPDSHNVRFSNGSSKEIPNMALIMTDFSNIDSGEKLHEQVEVPKTNATLPMEKRADVSEILTIEPLRRYPSNPVAIHKYRYISGYLLEDDKDTCVLAAFTFQPAENKLPGYSMTEDLTEARRIIHETLSSCKADGRTRLIVDMSANDGGYIDLGYELYRNLFPKAKMWTGSRIRAHPAADLLGSLLYDTAAQEIATAGLLQLDPTTGAPYKTWGDLYGPVSVTGDEMESNMLAANKSGPVDGKEFYVTGFAPNEVLPEQPFKTENIVVLTNGICISTCTIFTGLMQREQGVRTIAVGGRPLHTPMQAVGGSKGSQVAMPANIRQWFGYILNADRGNVTIKSKELAALLPSPDLPPLEPITLAGSGVNYRNAYADGADSTEDKEDDYPTQFLYEAANCRLFYKAEHMRSMAPLWRDVAAAAWKNASCVPESTVKRDGDKWIISDEVPQFTGRVRSRVYIYDGPGSLTSGVWQAYGKVNTTGLGDNYTLSEDDYVVPEGFKEMWAELADEENKKTNTEKEQENKEEEEKKEQEKSAAVGRLGPGTVQVLTTSVLVVVGMLAMI
ncbi:hypothetical protein B0T09DRAFT_317777 [Sordaria sp. MPI-SDFR-AT-0083]|nr:hypothetical protein B0T09DRAFT_317777 [Sordaria sp. MPI-SDFR-AT-0083]